MVATRKKYALIFLANPTVPEIESRFELSKKAGTGQKTILCRGLFQLFGQIYFNPPARG
jgi:hypothetical protein